MKVTICRKAHFNAAHKLYNKNLSMERNREIFGKCSNENYHGHNYELIVSMVGQLNEYGMVLNLSDVKHAIKTEITSQLDFRFLNKILFALINKYP